MGIACILALLAAFGASASLPDDAVQPRYGVVAPEHEAIDVAAYNAEIARQGIEHYCGSGNGDTLPALVEAYAPVYPAAERIAGVEGQATIVFDVLEDGTLANFKVESASAAAFAAAAIDALERWRFDPPKRKGTPIRTSSRQCFPFSLH